MPESYISSFFNIDPEEHRRDWYNFGSMLVHDPVNYTFDLENYIQGHWMGEWGHYLPELDTAELDVIRGKNKHDLNQAVQTDIRELMNNRFSSVLSGSTAEDTLKLIGDKNRLKYFEGLKKEDKFIDKFGEDYIDMVSDLDELGAFDVTQSGQQFHSEAGDMNAGLCYASCPECLDDSWSQECLQCTQDCHRAIVSDY